MSEETESQEKVLEVAIHVRLPMLALIFRDSDGSVVEAALTTRQASDIAAALLLAIHDVTERGPAPREGLAS